MVFGATCQVHQSNVQQFGYENYHLKNQDPHIESFMPKEGFGFQA
jgi:hypothetical protein